MKNEKGPVLNLDDFFGVSKPIVVNWQGKRYELKRPEAMGPVEFMRFQKLYDRMQKLSQVMGELSEGEANELRLMVADMLKLIAPDILAAELPFLAQFKVLEFYNLQVNEAAAAEAADPKATPDSNGTESIPA